MFASDDEGELAGDAGDGARSPDPVQRQNVASFDEDSDKKKQGCGSALFFCGSGSSFEFSELRIQAKAPCITVIK